MRGKGKIERGSVLIFGSVCMGLSCFAVRPFLSPAWTAMSLSNPTHIAALEWHSKGLNLAQ